MTAVAGGSQVRSPQSAVRSPASSSTLCPQSLVVIGILLLVGLVVRLAGIERQSLWLDEAGRVAIATLPLGEIRHGVEVIELSPPLYHYLLHGWMLIAGSGDGAVRLLSALLVLPTVPLAGWLGGMVGGRRVAWGTAALSALSPFAVHYGQEAAMYALLLPLCLLATGAALRVLAPAEPEETPLAAPRRRSRWLGVYVAAGILALYTHYYAAFLLASVAVVGVGQSLARRAPHGAALWLGAHLVIALAFLPWLPVWAQQARLAASVEEWGAVSVPQAVGAWSAALLTHTAPVPPGWPTAIMALALVVAAWRLRGSGPIVWLLVTLVGLPLVLGIIAAGFLHAFRERGYLSVVAAPWLLTATAVLAPGRPRFGRGLDPVARVALGGAVVVASGAGLAAHFAERTEDWRGAAALLQQGAGAEDPIFFVHFAGQVPFDRYFAGPQPRVGLPDSFTWERGYTARYRVSAADVEGRVPPTLAGHRQAWAVLSHDGGRGSEYLLAALQRWGRLAADDRRAGVRVLRFTTRAEPG